MNTINNQANDCVLVQACLEGQEEAFKIIYERYRLPLFAYLHRLLPGRYELVNDLSQQVWVKAVRNFSYYDDRQKLLAWLCRIAHNLAMDFFRRPGNAETGELSEAIAAEMDSPDEIIREQELNQTLLEAIDELPEDQREIVLMRSQGISFKDIATKKHINMNTALSRMHYAVLNLRKKLVDFL